MEGKKKIPKFRTGEDEKKKGRAVSALQGSVLWPKYMQKGDGKFQEERESNRGKLEKTGKKKKKGDAVGRELCEDTRPYHRASTETLTWPWFASRWKKREGVVEGIHGKGSRVALL